MEANTVSGGCGCVETDGAVQFADLQVAFPVCAVLCHKAPFEFRGINLLAEPWFLSANKYDPLIRALT
jgi:hypothetical protein